MAGSSSSAAVSPPLTRYDVFLNFRGQDTRPKFISHLYAELERKKIDTYIDYNLARGEEISSALHRAIEESMIYIVVFSKDYASSTWCLEELTKILDCKERYGRHVIPVFYEVDPTIVRNQSSETYAQAFVKHEDRFKDNIDKVDAWRKALTEAAGLAGWDSRVTRPEATLVAEIVNDILTKLNRFSISDHQGIVGIEDHIRRIQSMMHLESPATRIIGIWGMGGIGKTTIAKQIYHKLAMQFRSRSLVLNVREEIERHGIDKIKSKYKSELLEEDTSFSNERLKQTKVLLILDDVNDPRQLQDLIGGRGDFGQGSRIILTTRDRQVLKNAKADETYEVKEMNFQDSLNLFSIHAFHQNHPDPKMKDLSIKVLHYAKGIPLALQILGSLLDGRTEDEWEDELQKLNYLNLNLCLCFGLRSLTIPSNILSRSSGLITLTHCEELETFSIPNRTHHDRFPTRKGWDNGTASDSKGILSRVKGTFDPVRNIKIRHGKEECWLDLSGCISLTSHSFEFDLSKLKFLKKLLLDGCYNLETFPEIEDTMENLAVLKLDRTAIQALSSSLCRLVALQELSLRICASLKTIPSSIGNLSKLCNLGLTDCESLETFPSTIFMLKLTKLDLGGCSKLRTFPEILEPAQTFAHVDLTRTAIKELPSSFGNLVQLQTLRLNMCTDLESLPNSIVNLNLLSVLDCSGCAKLTHIPSDIGRLSLLRELSLSESRIVNLPEIIAHLSSLELLDLSDCKKLEYIPRLPPFLEEVSAFDCQSITRVMSNSLIQIPSNSKEGGIFRFYFTNGQQLDPGAHANIVDEARLRMTEDADRSVFFFFPGSEVPHWFPFHGEGHSITINTGSLNFCSDDRLMGFALCFVVQQLDTDDIVGIYDTLPYCLKYESDSGEHILPYDDEFEEEVYLIVKHRKIDQDHTFLWKYNLEFSGMSGMNHRLPRARSFTFEISPCFYDNFVPLGRDIKSTFKVKECGICPLYTKEKDDNNAGAGNYSGSVRFSKNDIEEPSGSDVAWKEEGL